jgi:glycosyltransferase involved in cell wall biosynthesis
MTDDRFRATILQVLPALDTGGVERGTVDIAGAIVAHGGRALVTSNGGRLVPQLERCGAEHITLPLDRKSPVAIWRNSHRLARLAQREQVSLIHARSRAPAWSALLAARRLGLPFVTTYHGAYGHSPALKRAYNSVMVRGDAVIAISEYIRAYILKHHPETDPAKITVIPRGVDLNAFNPATISASTLTVLRREWRLPEDGRPVILLPARPSRWKGIDVALAALARLPSRHWHAVLLGCTGTPYAETLVADAAALGIRDHVTFAPPTDAMPAAYRIADVVLSPATKPEAFGRIAIEAQAMGRPVIATDHGGAKETIRDGVTGWLVPPSDAEALALRLTDLLALETEERYALAVAARHQAETFSLEIMTTSTLSLYMGLLQKFRMKRI